MVNTNTDFEEPAYKESVFKEQLRVEISQGMAMAVDPTNANLPNLALRTTTINSPWYARTCRVCQDKFREGDQVRLCPECGAVYHDDAQYDLHCWQDHFASGKICTEGGFDRFSEAETPCCNYTWPGELPDQSRTESSSGSDSLPHVSPTAPLVDQFVTGLEKVWRPFGEQKSFKVQHDSPLVGRNCPWCRFRVRASDWVVACPCGNDCGTYFHQDVFRHLTCWNEWNGVAGNDYCPTTGAPYGKQNKEQYESDGVL